MADVVVLGAGIVGLAAAYELCRMGLAVVVVDADHRGRATDAGAGIVNPLDLVADQSAAERARLALRGPDYFRDLIARLAEDGETKHGYTNVGQILIARNAEEDADLDRIAARLSTMDTLTAGYLGRVRRLTGPQARELVPYLGECAGAVLLPGIAEVDGRRLRASLHGALRSRHTPFPVGVGRVAVSGDAVVGIDVDGARIDADRVIVATGAWSGAEWLAPPEALTADRGQIVHLSYRAGIGKTPVVSTMGGGYILGFEPDRIVVGATHEDAGFDYRVTAGGLLSVLGSALRIAPGLADATVVETRVGFRPVSRDGLPLLGSLPGPAGAVIATGLGAHGLTLGPAVGAIAARLAAGQDCGHDLTALRPDRFR